MREYFASAYGQLQPIQLSNSVAEGAAGTIHNVNSRPGEVAKLYKSAALCDEYAAKIAVMIARKPDLPNVTSAGASCVQIAWPTQEIRKATGQFVGFLMPEIDFARSRILESIMNQKMREVDGIAQFYGYRVLLAANLAALMAELHKLGHYMIDMKPENMRFYPGDWYMAILDTDGFSIRGDNIRIPSGQFSLDYIAPEAKGKGPETLGLEQDLFALAVIIFRLMNNGLHPYQGVPKTSKTLPSSVQERIFDELYSYGLTEHRDVGPSPISIHTSFEAETRALFDRAFLSRMNRPTASEWRNHLSSLLKANGGFRRCAANPDHGHFSLDCGFCEQEKRLNVAMAAVPAGTGRAASQQLSAKSLGAAFQSPTPTASRSVTKTSGRSAAAHSTALATPSRPRSRRRNVLGWIIAGLVCLGIANSVMKRLAPSASNLNAMQKPSDAQPVSTSVNRPLQFETSFDCDRATSWSEKQVCANAALADADRSLGNLYASMRTVAVGKMRTDLVRTQREWIASRDTCATASDPTACLTTAYRGREIDLKAMQSSQATVISAPTVPDINGPQHEIVSTESQSPGFILDPEWLSRPSGDDMARYYPERAQQLSRVGHVVLLCSVTASGSVFPCEVTKEDPPGFGFGDAAMKLSRLFRMRPKVENGQAMGGAKVNIPIVFQIADQSNAESN